MKLTPLLVQRQAAHALRWSAAIAAAWFSYRVGRQMGGLPIALLLAANGAAMGAILMGAVADRLLAVRR